MHKMRFCTLAPSALLTLLVACAAPFGSDERSAPEVDPNAVDPASNAAPGPRGQPEPGETGNAGEPPQLGLHYAHGAGPPTGGGSGAPLLTYHGGQIMQSSTITPIYWGAKWAAPTDPPSGFTGDKITGLQDLYSGLAGSEYARSNEEYTDGTGHHVVTGLGSITVNPYIIDNSTAPARAPKTSAIAAEVCAKIANPVPDGYYPVYTDTPRGSAGYCAWHSYTTCNNVPVQFAFFFSLDGDSGCDPQDTKTTHSQGLAALASVTGHEWSEMMTDPRNGGWWDSGGNENADKCAWSFDDQLVTLTNGAQFKIQGNWSNAAYAAKSGYGTRTTNYPGCLPNL